MSRFEKQRVKDFKATVIHYLESLMNSQQQVCMSGEELVQFTFLLHLCGKSVLSHMPPPLLLEWGGGGGGADIFLNFNP